MAISDKLNYLIETKSKFKDRLNSLGAEIIESTTFRNYLNWLDTFYNQSSDKTDLAENGVVGRTSQETTTGKNLFDYTTSTFSPPNVNVTTENNTITMTTVITVISRDLFFKTKIPDEYLINGETYTISSYNVSGVAQSLKLQLRNKDGSNAVKPQLNSVVYDNTYSLFIVGNIYSTDGQETIQQGTTAIIKNVQVEKGSTATSYEPYTGGEPSPSPDYPQEINNLSGDVEYKVRGKNLFDKNNANVLDEMFINAAARNIGSNANTTSIYIPINPNTTYCVSKTKGNRFAIGYSSTTPAVNVSLTNIVDDRTKTSLTSTSASDSKYLVIYISLSDTETYENIISTIQIEYGNTPTDYEPYISESFLLSLGDIELCNISDYKDRIYSQNGEFYLEKRTTKYNLFELPYIYSSSSTKPVDRTILQASNMGLKTMYLSNIFKSSLQNDTTVPNRIVTNNGTTGTWWVTLADDLTGIISSDNNTTKISKIIAYLQSKNAGLLTYSDEPTTTEITQENYPTLYSQLLAIQDFLTKYKINKEFLLDYSSPEIEY